MLSQRPKRIIKLVSVMTAAYFRESSKLATPIILQGLVTASLGMVGTFMIGQKGRRQSQPSGWPARCSSC